MSDPSTIPDGEPCPICGPKGHALHEDDSYGACVTCREYVAHTDGDYRLVPWPCPAARLAALSTTPAWTPDPSDPRSAKPLSTTPAPHQCREAEFRAILAAYPSGKPDKVSEWMTRAIAALEGAPHD